jgi:monofunctional biosynthetic peptidoglycan transglycosylase
MRRRFARYVIYALLVVLLAPAGLMLLYRVTPPPVTPLMLIRGGKSDYRWIPLTEISPALVRSVVTAEDEAFCTHRGFDKAALEKAWDQYLEDDGDKSLRGGSTISQQTTKNVFLWPGRTWLRKGLEAWLTVYLEALWDKKRIIEVYLNVAEWGPGVYGAEAAARHHFRKDAGSISRQEAALLAAVLPSPLKWSPSKPGPYVQARTEIISGRATRLGPLASCL